MDNNLVNDTIKQTAEIIISPNSAVNNKFDIWLLVSIVEFVIIIFIILFQKKKQTLTSQQQLKNEIIKEKIDFGNIINSSFHVKALYDELKVKCHPDRFSINDEENIIALELFQEISKNRTNYKKLIELKELAKNKLNLKF